MFFRWIEMQFDPNRGSFDENLFPMSWRVMLSYLKGRQSIYDNDYGKAREYLRFAFSFSHPDNPRNKKKILKFLVLVEINLNVFPTKALLQKYQLTEYIDLVESCQAGDMSKFEDALNRYMDYFIYGGVYLVVEKLRHLTLRNLMKKVALVVQKDKTLQVSEKQPHLIKLDIVHNILRKWDPEMDQDELECLLANQISMNHIKGYISHEKRLLVLPRQIEQAFPLKQ
jgi:nuclear mRNA export protein PCID2/THP1